MQGETTRAPDVQSRTCTAGALGGISRILKEIAKSPEFSTCLQKTVTGTWWGDFGKDAARPPDGERIPDP